MPHLRVVEVSDTMEALAPWLSEFVVGRAIENRTGPPVSSGFVNGADRVLGCRRVRSGRARNRNHTPLPLQRHFAKTGCTLTDESYCWSSEEGSMFEMVQLLAGTNLFLLAFSVLIFDIPRFT